MDGNIQVIGKMYAASGFVGNASTASKWKTKRTLTIGNTGKDVDGSANVSWSLTEIGVNIPLELTKVTKSLVVTGWTDMVSISSTDAGTYAIQISANTVMASGIFTICGGTDSVIDEIPLHVTDTANANTWRPYARVSGAQLQMTTNESSATSREYTIKIIKLI
jgi:hypothetical protein